MKRAQLKEISQVDAFKLIEKKKSNRFYVCKSGRKFIIKIMLFLKGMIKWLHMLLWLCTTSLEPSLIYPHGHICPKFHSTWQWHMDLITGKMIRNDRRLRLDLVLKSYYKKIHPKTWLLSECFIFWWLEKIKSDHDKYISLKKEKLLNESSNYIKTSHL